MKPLAIVLLFVASLGAQTTPNLNLNIPTPGTAVNNWGVLLNQNFSILDSLNPPGMNGPASFSLLSRTVYADQSAGSDACAKIAAAWNSLPSGGIVEASGFAPGSQACSSSPFLVGIHPGLMRLGNSTFQTTASWLMPQGVTLKGISSPTLTSQGGSIIQAVSGFPASTPVFQTGAGSINGTRVEEITIDCNGQSGAIGMQWNDSEEESGARHVAISGCAGIGLNIAGTGAQAQNAGPFEDLYVTSGGNGIPVAGTVGISVNKGDSEIRGVHGATINFTGAITPPTNCMVINTGGSYTDIHIEGCTNGINIAAPAHHTVFLYNIDCSTNVTDCIHITSGSVCAFGVGGTSTNFVHDLGNGTTISGSASYLSSYCGVGLNYIGNPVLLNAPQSGGTAASLTGTGACATINTQQGGSWSGLGKCVGSTAASTLVITPGITAPSGWVCYVQDMTTRANLFQQTASNQTSCTLTVTSVTQNDFFVFTAIAF